MVISQPERESINQLDSQHLYSRIDRRLSIGPMTADDTSEYVRLRLGRAGCDRDLFTSEALTPLHEAAGSSLREIDRVATAALRESARRKKKLVERDVMARVIGDVKSDAD
jgi:type II secretory pathway predicted ATPase ExeA